MAAYTATEEELKTFLPSPLKKFNLLKTRKQTIINKSKENVKLYRVFSSHKNI